MTIIEQIKAEIERKRDQNREGENSYYDVNDIKNAGIYRNRRILCEELLSFLSTIESEKTVPADLEKAAWEYASKECEKAAFIAGAKWQKEQMMDEWLKDRDGCFWDGVEEGKKAMREQMMLEAVDAIVEDWNPDPEPEITIPLNPEEFTCGDKVRVIVLPKED